jgi:hypothetical protein
MVFICV